MNIDTVVIEVKLGGKQSRVTDPQALTPFLPNAWKLEVNGYYRSWRFGFKKGRETGEYMPRISFYQQQVSKFAPIPILRIEFSIPKLLFNTDYRPVIHSSIEEVANILLEKLRMLGFGDLKLKPEQIYQAKVKRLDAYLDTTFETRAQMLLAIKRLNGVALPKPYKINQKSYFNGGFGLEFHDANRDIVFYDKETELKQSKKGDKTSRVECDNYCQFGLLDKLKQSKFAILRYEIKITNTKRLSTELAKFGVKAKEEDFTWFYNSGISIVILQHYWRMIFNSVPNYGLTTIDALTLLESVIASCPRVTLEKILSRFGKATLAQLENQNQVREILEHYLDRNAWSRFVEIYKMNTPSTHSDPLLKIDKQLQNMAAIHLNMIIPFYSKTLPLLSATSVDNHVGGNL